jgi:type III restriction enzyme
VKLHFEPNLDYQLQAVEAVCDLFRGQESCRTEFTVTMAAPRGDLLPQLESDLGLGNRLSLLDDEILSNVRAVQMRNGLPPSEKLESGDFTVEMETGTGKTYVYLRTIFELNRRYGFTKFVIVVPSVAIKEGVYKTLQMTEEHLRGLYANAPFDYFLYDSAKLGQVRNFATSPTIQIMVVTVGAINKKDVNNLYKDSEKTGGEKPIDLIRATRPIVIVDEPQSVDGGLAGEGKKALGAMSPLCTLRYSATHVAKHHMVYRLDAVDAYERKLVKQIEVAAATVEGTHNRPFVRFISASAKRGFVTAKVEVDDESSAGVRRKEASVRDGDDLEELTGRAIYQGCFIGEIRVGKGKELLELRVPGGEHFLRPGEAFGDMEPLGLQRQMIRRTIKEHLDKEMRLRPRGIKVLSLFFIDSVENYRKYDAEGAPQKGPFATLFEEEYRRLAKHPDYVSLFEGADLTTAAAEVHEGYFSIDRRRIGTKTVEVFKDTRGDTKADDDTYNLIMRDKERLLSFETPLKFIFSHSALREGWDNPNVFQICALRDMGTERERRQTIGRGLRLCVNQDGERLRGFEVNTLTVVATESYETFAESLQKEIEDETGIRFGVVEPHQFAGIAVAGSYTPGEVLGIDKSKSLWEFLATAGHIDAKGRIQDSLRQALKANALSLPPEFGGQAAQVKEVLRKLAGRLEIKNADERLKVRTRQAVLESEEFKALWDRIKHRTTYRVQFDNERLIRECTDALRTAPPIPRARLVWRSADLTIGRGGVEAEVVRESGPIAIDERDIELPDVLTDLQDKTQLTRRSIHRILIDSRRLKDFAANPQQFIELAVEVINRTKKLAIVDGIKYQRLGDEYYYAQELFTDEELTGYLKNLLEVKKSVYEHVVYDSAGVERSFAEDLERNEAVKVYAKLPGWFKVPTPLGSYNPDWAVLVEKDGAERLYFVVETKGSLFAGDLRGKEDAKIKCGKAHFEALAVGKNPARYEVVTSLGDLLGRSE